MFNIYIDDIDACAFELAELIKFADDTKTYRTVQCEEDRDKLQAVLGKLCAWAEKAGNVIQYHQMQSNAYWTQQQKIPEHHE